MNKDGELSALWNHGYGEVSIRARKAGQSEPGAGRGWMPCGRADIVVGTTRGERRRAGVPGPDDQG